MVHEGIFATSDEILVKAGADYDTAITEARINAECLQAESRINSETRRNWSDDYAGLNADVKHLLSEAEACLVAMAIISFNIKVYGLETGRLMLNYLWSSYQACREQLKTKEVEDFIDKET